MPSSAFAASKPPINAVAMVSKFVFYDMFGTELWGEPRLRNQRLYRISDWVWRNGRRYTVKRYALAAGIQHVNVATDAQLSASAAD